MTTVENPRQGRWRARSALLLLVWAAGFGCRAELLDRSVGEDSGSPDVAAIDTTAPADTLADTLADVLPDTASGGADASDTAGPDVPVDSGQDAADVADAAPDVSKDADLLDADATGADTPDTTAATDSQSDTPSDTATPDALVDAGNDADTAAQPDTPAQDAADAAPADTSKCPDPCDDGNPCTDDTCDPKSGCVYTPNAVPCSDGNACTEGDSCKDGKCTVGGAVACDDQNPCTDDTCDTKAGCTTKANTAKCDDGDACTTVDVCKSGTCTAGPAKVCDDGNPCTTDSCDPKTGCTASNNTATCDDGNPCTTDDFCKSGTCTAGPAKVCNDGNACTDDSCSNGNCLFAPNTAPCSTGSLCAQPGQCSAGDCKAEPVVCSDGQPCTADTCDPKTGKCVFPLQPCQRVACQLDSQCPAEQAHCHPSAQACFQCLSDAHCSNSKPACVDGQCTAGVPCASDVVCTPNKQVCDTGAGHCVDCVKDFDCGTGKYCSSNKCLALVKCQSALDCTGIGVCGTGTANGECVACNGDADCVGQANTYCGADHQCRPVLCKTGDCGALGYAVCKGGKSFGASVSCVDGKPCTADDCSPDKGCSNPVLADGSPCTGDEACPLAGCQAGTCTSAPLAMEATFTLGGVTTGSVYGLFPGSGNTLIGLGTNSPKFGQTRVVAFGLSALGKVLWVKPVTVAKTLNYNWYSVEYAASSDGQGGVWAVATPTGEATTSYELLHIGADGATLSSSPLTSLAFPPNYLTGDATTAWVAGYNSNTGSTVLARLNSAGQVQTSVSLTQQDPDYTGVSGLVRNGGKLGVVGTGKAGSGYYYVAWRDPQTLGVQTSSKIPSQWLIWPVVLPDGGLLVREQVTGGSVYHRWSALLDDQGTVPAPKNAAKPPVVLASGLVAVLEGADPNSTNLWAGHLVVYDPSKSMQQVEERFVGSATWGASLSYIVPLSNGPALLGYRRSANGAFGHWFTRPDATGALACPCVAQAKAVGSCDDNNPCTLDACDAKAGCTHATLMVGVACDDGYPYTSVSQCAVGGACVAKCKEVQVSTYAGNPPLAVDIDSGGTVRALLREVNPTSGYGVTREVALRPDGTQLTGPAIGGTSDYWNKAMMWDDGSWLIARYDYFSAGFNVSKVDANTGVATAIYTGWNQTPMQDWQVGCATSDPVLWFYVLNTDGSLKIYPSNIGQTIDLGAVAPSNTSGLNLGAHVGLTRTCGEAVICARGEVAGATANDLVVRFQKGGSDAWKTTIAVGAIPNEGYVQCMAVPGSSGAVVRIYDTTSQTYTARYLDDSGKLAWTWNQVYGDGQPSGQLYFKGPAGLVGGGNMPTDYSLGTYAFAAWPFAANGSLGAIGTYVPGPPGNYTPAAMRGRYVNNKYVFGGYGWPKPTPAAGFATYRWEMTDLQKAACLP